MRSWWQVRHTSGAQRAAARRRAAERREWERRLAADEGDRNERAGYLAAVLAGQRPATMEDGSMDPKLRKAIADRVKLITADRDREVGDLLGRYRALATDDGRDPAWKERERQRLRAAVEDRNAAARAELATVVEPLVKSARTRQATGTPLESSALAEAQLLVTQYGSRSKPEQRHLAREAAEALEAGAVDRARTLHRAAVALGVEDAQVGQALDAADPVKRSAQEDLSTVSQLLESHELAITEELANAGVTGVSGQIAAKAGAFLAQHHEASA